MIAIDTNVVVRVLTADDPAQVAAAREAMRDGPVFLGKTVLLETEWVLRFAYRLSREAIGGALRGLIAYRDLEVEDEEAVIEALSWYGSGLDLADALHLASASRAERFVTFDRRFAGAAAKLGCRPPVKLLR